MKRRIIKILLRYRKLISDHKGEHETLQSLSYYNSLARTGIDKVIERDAKELKVVDDLIKDIKNGVI